MAFDKISIRGSKPFVKKGQHIFTIEGGIPNISHSGHRRADDGQGATM
jgi:hypothetical protein